MKPKISHPISRLALLLSFYFCLFSLTSHAQAPEAFKYQTVVRNSSNQIIPNQAVSLRISILQTSPTGTAVYVETHAATTNILGLVNLEIGNGTLVSGSFSTISWGTNSYFVKIELDPAGGTAYQDMGTSQLLSVPYALHAKTAETISYTETDPVFTASPSSGITSGNITNWNTAYGWGNHANAGYLTNFSETDPLFGASPASGITSGNITNWNTAHGWGNHAGLYRPVSWVPSWLDLTGKPTTLSGYGIIDAMNIAHPANSITNMQIVNWNTAYGWGNHAVMGYLTGNQPVTLSGDVTGNGTINISTTIANNAVTTSKIANVAVTEAKLADNSVTTDKISGSAVTGAKIAQAGATAGQVLKWNGTTWTPADDLQDSGGSNPTGPAGGDLTGAYPNPSIVNNAVTTAKIANTAVTDVKIADNAVTTTKIANTAVTEEKLANNAVTTTKIADNAVTTAKLANNSVTVAKLPAGATASTFLRGDGTWAIPYSGISTETDPTWNGAANDSSAIGRTGNVGIGTITPAALLHTYGTDTSGGNVLFEGEIKYLNPGDPPATGDGTRMMWYPDKAAFRAGYVNDTQWNKNNIGDFSVAFGSNTEASGMASIAMGSLAIASGDFSFSHGFYTEASGMNSVALGGFCDASGHNSTAIGQYNYATGFYSMALGANNITSGSFSTALGQGSNSFGNYSLALGNNVQAHSFCEIVTGHYNTDYTPASTTAWNSSDRLFVVGNGSSGTVKSNALTILKNGNTGIGTSTPQTQLHTTGSVRFDGLSTATQTQAVMTDASGNLSKRTLNTVAFNGETDPTWSGSADQTGNIGRTGNIGIGTTSPSAQLHTTGSVRFAGLSTATQTQAVMTDAGGNLSKRTLNTVAFNGETDPKWSGTADQTGNIGRTGKVGIGTTSPTGLLTVDGGGAGTSFPAIRANNTNASGIALFASANSTDATLVVSQANTTAAGGVIAKFFSTGSYEVVKIGRIMEGFDAGGGIINLRGNNTATGGGFIFGHSTYGLVLGTFNAANDYYQVAGAYQPPTGNIVFMPWSYNNTDLGNSSFRWAAVYAVNGTIQTSDKNQKENIQDISYGLDAVMQLKPISYTWKDRSCSVGTGTNYGFIAQDLEKVIPDVVVHSITSHEEIENARKEKGIELDPETYGVKYSELIPVMVKAMQEQQEMIEHQQEMIDKQHIQMEFLQKQIDEMKRMIK